MSDREQVRERLKEDRIQYIVVQFVDIHGSAKSKMVPVECFDDANPETLAGLTGGAEALLGWRVLTILMSLLGLVYYLQGRKRFVHAAQEIMAAKAASSQRP